MSERGSRHRLAAFLVGLIALAASGGILGANLPAAAARSDRVGAVLDLERQALALAKEAEGISVEASAARSAIQEQSASALAVQAKIDRQLKRISRLKGTVKDIRAAVEDLEKELDDLQG